MNHLAPGKNPNRNQSASRKRVAVALQGGGSHGAFTWGVLDRLLQEPELEIVGISGTSAGAMNAAVLADGLRRGGATEARKALEQFWEDVGRLPGYAHFFPTPLFGGKRVWHLDRNPLFLWHDMLTRIWSPYQTNPHNFNPLRDLLTRIDFDGLRSDPQAARVFICATNVRTGLRRVFENAELSADVLLASAALPQVYQAVEVEGEHYWDGGYTGNPALTPLHLYTDATDVIAVDINPRLRADLPRSARAIIDRVDEISFNATFLAEVGAIAFIDQLVASQPSATSFKRLYVHAIADDSLGSFGASSKMNNHPDFLHHLRRIGAQAAQRWLEENRDAVGKRSTVDVSGLDLARHGHLSHSSRIRQPRAVQA